MYFCYVRALESFIRAKYEQRKWIAKEWIPPEITVPIDVGVVYMMRSESVRENSIKRFGKKCSR